MKIENKLITDLKPATYNPRQISTKQYNDLKESVKRFGLVDPIIINKDNTVVGGHQRLKIAKELKYIDIECVVLDLSKAEERELNIRLNKNTGGLCRDCHIKAESDSMFNMFCRIQHLENVTNQVYALIEYKRKYENRK